MKAAVYQEVLDIEVVVRALEAKATKVKPRQGQETARLINLTLDLRTLRAFSFGLT